MAGRGGSCDEKEGAGGPRRVFEGLSRLGTDRVGLNGSVADAEGLWRPLLW